MWGDVKMENTQFCQSCSMPLVNAEDFGTNADGSRNEDYCKYCYVDGAFAGEECTMDEMIEICIPFCLEAGAYRDADEARAAMRVSFPTLKRWAPIH